MEHRRLARSDFGEAELGVGNHAMWVGRDEAQTIDGRLHRTRKEKGLAGVEK